MWENCWDSRKPLLTHCRSVCMLNYYPRCLVSARCLACCIRTHCRSDRNTFFFGGIRDLLQSWHSGAFGAFGRFPMPLQVFREIAVEVLICNGLSAARFARLRQPGFRHFSITSYRIPEKSQRHRDIPQSWGIRDVLQSWSGLKNVPNAPNASLGLAGKPGRKGAIHDPLWARFHRRARRPPVQRSERPTVSTGPIKPGPPAAT